ncbi:sulfatase-like hydrolase/transferase, partial [Balneolaceae bacterium ANBcel3]|nr:sulfatase-like hydrolase/transferase [Balneolaceae bacterium ANBcel3]
NGYSVYGTGKVFHNGHEDWSVWRGDDPIGHFGYESSFGPFAWDGSYDRGDWDHALGLPHPDVLEVDINEHPEYRGHWGQSFGPLSDIPSYPPNPETGAPGYDGWILYGEPWHYEDDDNRDLMPDELNAKYAATVLEQDHKAPFFLFVGLNRPHTPFHAPQKYFDMYPLEDLKLPNVKENVLDDVPDMLWNPCQTAHCNGYNAFERIINHPKPDMWLKTVQAYLASVTFVDDVVGDIMESIMESRYADNTVVIITSDHGLHLGEKEYLRSKMTVWEESSHIPFIVWSSDLEHPGARISHPVSLIDLYPTIIDIAGLPAEPNASGNGLPLEGHSLLPFIENPDFDAWEGPDFALMSVPSGEFLELNEPGIPARQFHSIRTERYRYSLMPNGEQELYDHENDPFEWTNLARVEGHEELLREFRRKLLDFIHPERN